MPVGCYTVAMDAQDVERRLREIELKLEIGKQWRQERREHVEAARKRRNFYGILGRVFALALAYPFIALFLWFIETPRPWVHALTPAITVFMFTLVAPLIQKALLAYTRERHEERREDMAGLE
ncbi:MAG: hypothetical protein UY94_C0038G0005 [Parcubacteria group bacterium GW2011_GWA2_56_21]|nr:MAG: hypothetical protein UY94_C0038G0005 [Parcubacteria group bacterium GW2011_GWA2_56_21]